MVENQRNWCQFPYLDNVIFEKTRLKTRQRFMREEDRIIVAETTTKNVYSIFNGVDVLKSAEFVGFRIPTGNNIYLQGQGYPLALIASS